VGVAFGVLLGVTVEVAVGVTVAVAVGVTVAVAVGMTVAVAVGVTTGLIVGVAVIVDAAAGLSVSAVADGAHVAPDFGCWLWEPPGLGEFPAPELAPAEAVPAPVVLPPPVPKTLLKDEETAVRNGGTVNPAVTTNAGSERRPQPRAETKAGVTGPAAPTRPAVPGCRALAARLICAPFRHAEHPEQPDMSGS
jgi:hypothetical protein